MRKIVKMLVPVILVSLAVSGCGGRVSEDKPISEIKTEVQSMSAKQLQDMIDKYQKAIDAKKADVKEVKEKIREIPATGLMGDEAKKLREEITKLSNSVSALAQRMNIYAQELRRKQ